MHISETPAERSDTTAPAGVRLLAASLESGPRNPAPAYKPELANEDGTAIVQRRAHGEELRLESHMPEGGVIFSDGIDADYLAFNSGAVAMIRAAKQQTRLVAA